MFQAVRIVVKRFYIAKDVPIVEASIELEDVASAVAVRYSNAARRPFTF